MTRLAAAAFVLAVLLITVSAYIRLSQGGIGCSPWPDCYAHVAGAPQAFPVAAPLHRISASLLGLLVLALNAVAWRQRRQRIPCAAILLVTLLLAALGVRSGGLLLPAVVLGNFLGGLLLASLLGWLLIDHHASPAATSGVRATALATLAFAGVAIVAGIASSAFYGNTAWTGRTVAVPPGLSLPLDPFTPLTVDALGFAVPPDHAQALNGLHRLLGSVLVLAFAGSVFTVWRSRLRMPAIATQLFLAVAAGIGLVAGTDGLPVGVAVLHSLSGLVVVLMLLRMLRRA